MAGLVQTANFDKAVFRLLADHGLSVKQFMLSQMKQQVQNLVKFTPAANLTIGKKALLKDYGKLFSEMNANPLKRLRKRYPQEDMFKVMTSSAMRNYHRSQQDKRGRVKKRRPSMVTLGKGKHNEFDRSKQYVLKSDFRNYRDYLLRQLGKTKAGWLGGGNLFRAKTTGLNWVTRHKPWGTASDEMDKTGNGRLTVTNNVKWVSRFESELQKLADNIRAKAIQKGLRAQIDRLAKEFNKSKGQARQAA